MYANLFLGLLFFMKLFNFDLHIRRNRAILGVEDGVLIGIQSREECKMLWSDSTMSGTGRLGGISRRRLEHFS